MNKLYIISGKQITQMTIDLLKEMKPLKEKNKDILIGIKPNLVCASPASSGATTHPEIVEGIIIYLKNNNFKNISIIEGSWIGDSTSRAAEVCGYVDICKKYSVPFIDTKSDTYLNYIVDDMNMVVCDSAMKIDYLINVPLIKGHCQTDITCALKNMKGLIPDTEKRRYHQIGLHKPIAYLNKVIKQDLIIADGICPDPYFEEGGRPKQMDKIVGAYDPVLMDSYAAGVLGYDPQSIEYIRLAAKLHVGKMMDDNTIIIKIGENHKDIQIKNIDKKYLNIISEDNACSACYSSLVMALDKMHEDGHTQKLTHQICVGQGYRNFTGEIGIGDCTKDFVHSLAGCPPRKEEIIEFLIDCIEKGYA